MNLGIALPNLVAPADQEVVLPFARAADAHGFHSVWVNDHVLRLWGLRFIEPVATAAAMAAATERILVGTSVLVLPYRNPLLLANAAATIDALSGGRLLLGLGAGSADDEFRTLGVDPAERGPRTDEGLEVLKLLWRDAPADLDGRFSSFRGAQIGASPTTPGGPPIWIGGSSRAALRRTVRFADAWHGGNVFPDELPAIRARLDALADEAGRDPATIGLTTLAMVAVPGLASNAPAGARVLGGPSPSAQAIRDDLGRFAEAGYDTVVLWPRTPADQALEGLEWLAAEVLPRQ